MSRKQRLTGWAIAGMLFGAVWVVFVPVLAETTPSLAKSGKEVEVLPPEIIIESQKSPEYPPAALAARFSGAVTLQASIQSNGTVGVVKVLECTAPSLGFEQAAIAAVKQWRFEPATQGGQPVDYEMKFRLNFRGTAADARQPRVTAGSFGTPESPASRGASTTTSPDSRSRGR